MRSGDRKAWEGYLRTRAQCAPTGSRYALPLALPRSRATKHGNEPVMMFGLRFQSRLEADRYRELTIERAAGHVAYFLHQVPFRLAPGVVWRADFLIVWNRSGSWGDIVTVEDTKGHLTETARVKIRCVEDRYQLKVRIVRRAEVRHFT